ncbi:hypothetical protein HELRODRAFT_161763 [Helobdella robusta]|uniref:WSC domain-containing protein n=1 Tax=Helobdella robusta TaxID=6412 RepID=T1ERV6_HELRO|nr:hypothetical protein HELRODRAFT_161763 [Helobdella robusta]ESO02489.1 hypothetical protein HELRODRAFT_161763 [Helobdella robusta]
MKANFQYFLMLNIVCAFVIVSTNLSSSVAHAAIDLKESYIGCYRNISSTKTVASVGSVDECSLECTDESNNMIALKSGKECNCIGRLDSAVASSQCDVRCANRDACGGRDSYSVYKSKPRKTHDDYASFETRQTDVILITLPNTYTFEMCAHFCFETNYTFFQKIDPSKRCGCFQEHGTGNSYFTNLICMTCSSNRSEVCRCYHQGHREKITIFATRFQYDFQRGVSTYSHCRNRNNGSYEITANCPDGCDPGWRGDSCRERDCSSGGGDCPVGMECIESTVNGNKYVECVCPSGKVRNKWYQCEVFRKNLALHKPPYYSSHIYEHDGVMGAHNKIHLTDGNYDGHHVSHLFDDMPCWMAVDLLSLYCVGFIRAYNRISQKTEFLERLDKFVVRLNETFDVSNREDIRDKVNLCGYGPEKAIQGGNPMIVFCENFTILTRFVFIQPSDKGMEDGHSALAELEVFEAGCDLFNGRCGEVEPCREVKKKGTVTISCSYKTTTAANANEASHATTEASHATTEASHATIEASHATTETSHATTEENNATTEASHATTEASHATTEENNATTEASHATTEENNATTEENNATTEAGSATTKAGNGKTGKVYAKPPSSNVFSIVGIIGAILVALATCVLVVMLLKKRKKKEEEEERESKDAQSEASPEEDEL